MYRKFGKRILDLFIAVPSALILLPINIIVALIIRLYDKGPVFFKQQRIGQKKQPFFMLKYRTMRVDAPENTPTHELQDPNQYITKVGKFLRAASLDELPQLYHIIKGEMSLVGPRPALWNQYDLIAEREKYGANDIKPGLTGWAQINGRDELPIPEKAKLDGWYSSHLSFALDIHCIIGTVWAVISRRGVREGKNDSL